MSRTTIAMSDALDAYTARMGVREHPVLRHLREVTADLASADMQIAPQQGAFMQLLVRLMGARRTLEIGVFTGYSALAVALALPSDGEIVGLDVSEEYTTIAKRHFRDANVAHKLDLRLGPARDSLEDLIDAGEEAGFDFAFIDADKENYDLYYEKSLTLVRRGGLICIDNVLWGGRVIDPEASDTDTKAIRALNAKIADDARVQVSMLPIADGVTLALKL